MQSLIHAALVYLVTLDGRGTVTHHVRVKSTLSQWEGFAAATILVFLTFVLPINVKILLKIVLMTAAAMVLV